MLKVGTSHCQYRYNKKFQKHQSSSAIVILLTVSLLKIYCIVVLTQVHLLYTYGP